MTSPAPRHPGYPAPLQAQITHAGRFARSLGVLHEKAATRDAASLWLEGRAEEVEVFTVDVLRAWSSGELATSAAARVIEDYLRALHASLEVWYGQSYPPACCGPLAGQHESGVRTRTESALPRRADTLLDTLSDTAAPV